MTAVKAAGYLAKLKEAQKTGQGPQTLKESREIKAEQRKAQKAALKQAQIDCLTVSEVYTEHYLPHAQENKKFKTVQAEDSHFRNWIDPAIGEKPIKTVSPFDVEKIKKAMADADLSPRSIQYCLATTRQLFNHASFVGLFEGGNPVRKVKIPTPNNKRIRFLSEAEADLLLKTLAGKSTQLYEIALFGLDTGARAGEIFNLTWGDVDLERSLLSIRDAKGGKSRFIPMTNQVREMLSGKPGGEPTALVFPSRKGEKIQQVSKVFYLTVKELGLNKGVVDPRQKVNFHTLRHTFASWLVERGTDLYTVKTLLGHSTIQLTERYSHLAPDALRQAVKVLEREREPAAAKIVNLDTGGEK